MTGEARARVAPIPEWYPRFASLRLFGRLISGRRLEGGKRTGRWTNARVAALRWAIFGWCAFTLFLLFAGIFSAHSFVQVQLWLAIWGGYGLARLARLVWELFVNWYLRDRIIHPLHIALHEPNNLVGFPEDERPERYIHVPLGWDKGEGKTVTIELRPGYANTDDKRDQFVSVVAATMGATVRKASVSWDTSGKRPHVAIRPAFPPPRVAWFADNIERIEKARKPGEIVWGVQDHNKLLKVDIASDTPHGMIAAQTGRGKSQAIAGGGAQLLHDGFVGAVLDYKGRSDPCFIDIPNAVYAGDVEECDWLAVALRDEFYRRRDLLKDWKRGDTKPDIGPSIVIMIEESDSLMGALRNLHERRGNGRSNVPSIDALNELKFMGRELRMHQLSVTQSGSARAAGGGDARSQFGWALISGDKSTWQKATGKTEKPPPISTIKGRWHLYRNGSETEVQVFGFPDPAEASDDEKMEEARVYALSGIVTPVPENLKLPVGTISENVSEPNEIAGRTVPQPYRLRHQPGHRSGHLSVVRDTPLESLTARIAAGVYADPEPEPSHDLLSIVEACERGVLPMNVDAARKASQRAGFPEVKLRSVPARGGTPEKRYSLVELVAWVEQRRKVDAHG